MTTTTLEILRTGPLAVPKSSTERADALVEAAPTVVDPHLCEPRSTRPA